MHVQTHICFYGIHNSPWSEMLFTKQEKGQENQANQQKSLSSPKKRTIVLPEADCSDRDIEDSEVGKSRSICIPIPLLPLPNAFAALLLWEQMAGMCLSQRLWHHPHPGTAPSALLTAAPLQPNSAIPQWWNQDKGTAVGTSPGMKRAAGKQTPG